MVTTDTNGVPHPIPSGTEISLDESNMDENDLRTLRAAARAQAHGESFFAAFRDPANYQPFLESLMRSLARRESILGRYNNVTALTYSSIGNAYRHLEENRAVAFFRTQYRIQTVLYGKTNGHISGVLRDILQRRGMSDTDLDDIRKDILTSTRHELEGDTYRRYGDRHNAILEYQRAARVEELSFGRDNPDLAFIWRKMACLAAIKEENGMNPGTINFDEADRMGNRWMKQSNESLSPNICSLIRRGDNYYATLLYGNAVAVYYKASAALSLSNDFQNKKTGKVRKTRSNSTQKSKRVNDVSEELQQFLQGGHDQSGAPSEPAPQQALATEQHTDDSVASKAKRASTRNLAAKEDRSTKSADTASNATTPLVVTKKKKRLTSKLQTATKRTEAHHPSDSSYVSALSEVSRPISEKPEPRSSLVISTSRIRRKPRSTRSESSLLTAMSLDKSENPVRPKSDSYLAKIATTTRKVASKTTKMAKKQITRGAKGIKDFTLGDHSDKKQPTVVQDGREKKPAKSSKSGSKTKESKKGKGSTHSSYSAMASPPPTPIATTVNATKTASKSKKQSESDKGIYEETKEEITLPHLFQFLPNAPISPTEIPGESGSLVSGAEFASMGGDLSLGGTEFASLAGSSPVVMNERAEYSTASLSKFFSSPRYSSDEETTFVDNRSACEQSVFTTDEEIRERFLSVTHKTTKGIPSSSTTSQKRDGKLKKANLNYLTDSDESSQDAEPGNGIPLVDLVANIQTMSSLLQRQTVRLQNRLIGSPVSANDNHEDTHTAARVTPKGTNDLYQEVQRLFFECDATLGIAFDQLDQAALSGNTNIAMEEYRKTFSLEKAFLEELRRKLSNILGKSDKSERQGGSTHRMIRVDSPISQEGIEVEANFEDSAATSFGETNESAATNTSTEEGEGMLSVVLEEHSTPSSGQKQPNTDGKLPYQWQTAEGKENGPRQVIL